MNGIDFAILAIIFVLVVLAVRYAWNHRNSCGGNCSGCSHSQSCQNLRDHSEKK
ncbi:MULTISPECIES: FeoB-associated Cys-rich membrane protein [unclassified Anaeromassilibacillus]|uniref:FeoB-associated Cys-rich membrane protein n=1 Tax=unclassified Anaeromassilibacillus TaxID=2625359 RepID=UPI0009EC3508|nr:FeoB-associated Cys-rich membrane protein [Anaeromassilibacillus sp. Marseille-P3371]